MSDSCSGPSGLCSSSEAMTPFLEQVKSHFPTFPAMQTPLKVRSGTIPFSSWLDIGKVIENEKNTSITHHNTELKAQREVIAKLS